MNFNPHSPCGERLHLLPFLLVLALISIHTPHAGSDIFFVSLVQCKSISIHTPHAGSDCSFFCPNFISAIFQSTLPMRGATFSTVVLFRLSTLFQSTLPMRGATRCVRPSFATLSHFNPHSPCGERHLPSPGTSTSKIFQSTLPMRGATSCHLPNSSSQTISIHTPHAGSDDFLRCRMLRV